MTKHRNIGSHAVTIKMNQALRQAIAQIRRPSMTAVANLNARLWADYTDKAKGGKP